MSHDNPQPKFPPIHLMLDFETLSLQPNAMVLSAGICEIWPEEEGNRKHAYWEFALTPQTARHIDPETVAWWMEQEIKPPMNGTDGFWRIFEWLRAVEVSREIILWANGTDFDITVLKDIAYENHQILPFKYSNVRDFRTMRKCFPLPKDKEPATITKHNALEDALWQARYLEALVEYYGFGDLS